MSKPGWVYYLDADDGAYIAYCHECGDARTRLGQPLGPVEAPLHDDEQRLVDYGCPDCKAPLETVKPEGVSHVE